MTASSHAYDLAVVGAGAAGLATAIFTARHAFHPRIVALDGAKQLGAKILVSGGGRCNVTNSVVTAGDFCGGSRRIIERVLRSFPVAQTVKFFREIGVTLHEEPGGKLFPDSHRARTVLDAMLNEARRLGIDTLSANRVHQITRPAEITDGFVLHTSAGPIPARRIVLATGGRSLPKTGSDGGGYLLAQSLGHTIVPPTPALAPLVLEGDFHAPLAGVSHEAALTVRAEGQRAVRLCGALLWTHFGVSGPLAMNASRHWLRARIENRAVSVGLSFVPDLAFETLEAALLSLAASQPRSHLHNALRAPESPATAIPERVLAALLERLNLGRGIVMAHLSREDRRRLIHAMLDWPLPIRDSRGYNYAEATAGGVPLEEIDARTMESRRCVGLYLVGEILDVDGRIGGFNFQWAWSSGYVAGRAIAGSLASGPL
ncbi:MAG: aminoacetone oxidase family FAD-binding enzyme [Phycisphaerae bacterium]|nr:aminoacetone oxidase family FAD-binding enzyme [Phycisphaerae bacterium]NUQ44903.1 aminoacetone oxidase family FAD-binding enzyme [Phycisphaerae bacterium]